MTNPPPVAPVVTDEMVEAGLHKWFESESEEIDRKKVERLQTALERMLLEYDFMVEAGLIPDTRDDVIFVEARAALEGEE